MKAVLGLEDGDSVVGKGFGVEGSCAGELVFCTTMTGYMEALTDPSYNGQILMFTYPLIGNYGVDEGNFQSDGVKALGCVVREICRAPSGGPPLDRYFERNGLFGITGVDTRRLTIKCREKGTMRAALIVGDDSREQAVERAQKVPLITEVDLIAAVSCKEPYRISGPGKRIAVLDLGIKRNQLVSMSNRGADLHVFPHDTPHDIVAASRPDALFISNGPGDPKRAVASIECVRSLHRGDPDLRHLLREPDHRPRPRGRHLQAEVRPPGHEPAGPVQRRVHLYHHPEPWLRRGWRDTPRGVHRLPHERERWDPRGLRG